MAQRSSRMQSGGNGCRVQAAMCGKEESEMRGLSVLFIASALPSLIKGAGETYGLFAGVKKGPLSPEDSRPYDVAEPLFRETSKDQICPRVGLPGCAFVDYVHTVRPSPPGACSLHPPHGRWLAEARR
jgi:hypothetical protein